MKLTEFSITHFRSITKAEKIPISQNTVIVGPNNEGKSNILNAIAISMSEINRQAEDINDPNRARRRRVYSRRNSVSESTEFIWSRDYPLSKQEKRNAKEQGRTKFRLTFALNEEELGEFKHEIGSSLNGQLEVELSFGYKIEPEFRVIKRGPHNATLAKKRKKIASFLGERLSVNYIPAVRTEEHSLNVIYNMIRSQLKTVEKQKEYQDAIETIQNIQRPVLEKLSESVTRSMQGFIPQVKNVDIGGLGLDRIRSAVQPDVQIDDGTVTPISQKGDGIKSLAAISLLHQLGVEASGSTVLLVEEPETHLHSGAIHRLRRVLEDLSLEQQVIITTHHAIFANRIDVSGNVIVRGNAAKPAKRIHEVRDVLGVHASENLQNANLVLLVEGEDDKIVLEAILPKLSSTVRQALSQGFLMSTCSPHPG
jgi:predicted ATPase